jgi:hypothetical protein
MKLRNKKTGEIVEIRKDEEIIMPLIDDEGDWYEECYSSLAELNSEWEEYEEPKVGYIIDPMEEDCVSADDSGYEESDVERAKELGIWFETKEEAEKAVEKLKAWKRLKDKGFKFVDFNRVNDCASLIRATFDEGWSEIYDDLNTCFGGEE